jgi:hypothetical protein
VNQISIFIPEQRWRLPTVAEFVRLSVGPCKENKLGQLGSFRYAHGSVVVKAIDDATQEMKAWQERHALTEDQKALCQVHVQHPFARPQDPDMLYTLVYWSYKPDPHTVIFNEIPPVFNSTKETP